MIESAKALEIKLGVNLCGFIWVPTNDTYKTNPADFGFDDFDLIYYLTKDHHS